MQIPDLSGVILTHNNRDPSLPIAQLSRLCDQVVVVQDARDGELDPSLLAKGRRDCKITLLARAFDTFANQRNAGLERTLGEWTLLIDSDEAVSSELRAEISGLTPDPDTDIYTMQRQESIRGKQLSVSSPCGRIGAQHPRLFRSHLRYVEHPSPHPRFEGEHLLQATPLSGKIEHMPDETFLQLCKKSFRYGRLYDVPEATGEAPRDGDILRDLVQFVRHDGLRGAAVAATVLAFGLGTKLPKTAVDASQKRVQFAVPSLGA